MEILREVDGSCREWYIYDYLGNLQYFVISCSVTLIALIDRLISDTYNQ